VLLCNIYFNDFSSSIDNSANVIMYANDTSILTANNWYEDLNRNFNIVLYNILKWFQVNQLVLTL